MLYRIKLLLNVDFQKSTCNKWGVKTRNPNQSMILELCLRETAIFPKRSKNSGNGMTCDMKKPYVMSCDGRSQTNETLKIVSNN